MCWHNPPEAGAMPLEINTGTEWHSTDLGDIVGTFGKMATEPKPRRCGAGMPGPSQRKSARSWTAILKRGGSGLRAMARPLLLAAVAWCVLAATAQAETVYLKTGEVIKGKIVRADAGTISVDTEKGFGVIQIKRDDIIEIEFDQNARDISRFFGVGYYHRVMPLRLEALGLVYGQDAISLKMWFGANSAFELLFGFYSASGSGGASYDVLSLEVRYMKVFTRRARLDMYWGAGGGILDVTDSSTGLSDSGTTLEAFLGAESHISTMPNLTISTEIALVIQEVGSNVSSTVISPSVVMRYYF